MARAPIVGGQHPSRCAGRARERRPCGRDGAQRGGGRPLHGPGRVNPRPGAVRREGALRMEGVAATWGQMSDGNPSDLGPEECRLPAPPPRTARTVWGPRMVPRPRRRPAMGRLPRRRGASTRPRLPPPGTSRMQEPQPSGAACSRNRPIASRLWSAPTPHLTERREAAWRMISLDARLASRYAVRIAGR